MLQGLSEQATSSGLTGAEAAARLRAEGPNELPGRRSPAWLQAVSELVGEPMFLLLAACGGLYWVLGDAQEAAMLLGFIVFIVVISLYQGRKTENALTALRDMSSPRALVIRDGAQVRIAGREVVRGDLMVLDEGDRVPADAIVRRAVNLAVDESLLSGESVPVRKAATPDARPMERPGGDDTPFVYAGTLVVRGRGVAEVQATGSGTELGRIGTALRRAPPPPTRLQRETAQVVRLVAAAGFGLCLVTSLVYGVTRSDWVNGALVGLSLAMAIMPNELPVVLTVFLALGAWRMAQRRVLTRSMSAVEALGSATVLCVDKTGTLTQNCMTVAELQTDEASWRPQAPMPPAVVDLLRHAALACQPDPSDPMDRAIVALAPPAEPGWTLVREYTLTATLMSLSNAWRRDGAWRIAAKGAPESLMSLCHVPPDVARILQGHVDRMAADGLRVLGVATAEGVHEGDDIDLDALPDEQHAYDFRWLGLVGLADPVRPAVPGAIEQCRAAGLRVVMITGDHPSTACAIARQIGLDHADAFVTGPTLAAMDDDALQARLATTCVFCRTLPEQKLRLVEALRARGEVVAMTGDGVNDAAALRAADIGIAMGGRGSDVAREAAALVLLDDDFESIVAAVHRGRGVYANLKRAMAYLFGIHLPIVALSVVPVVLQWPLVLLPAHIAFLHLIIDPACSIVFEAEPLSDALMREPPRRPEARLFGDRVIRLGLLQGAVLASIVLGVFAIAWVRGQDAADARALTFTTLVLANVGLILACRDSALSPNPALGGVSVGALALLVAVLYVPGLQALFRFSSLHAIDLVVCLAASGLGVALFELVRRRAMRDRAPGDRGAGRPA